MAKILLTWELGGYLGHIRRLKLIADEFTKRGHTVSFALRDLSRTEGIFGDDRYQVFQAPIWLPKAVGAPSPTYSFAEILIRFGYLDAEGLMGLVRGWQALFDRQKPELVFFDYAPTGLIASRGYGFKKVVVGSGFYVPPAIHPMPNMRYWETVSGDRLQKAEDRVVGCVNKVLARFGQKPIRALYELFDADKSLIFSYPPLDHYPQRTNGNYVGILEAPDTARTPDWPNGKNARIFAYLKPEHEGFDAIMQVLSNSDHAVLVYAHNVPAKFVSRYSNETTRISREPYDIHLMAEQADLFVNHAGHDTLSHGLLAGKPLLLLPMQLEQALMAKRVVDMGAGLSVAPNTQARQLEKYLETVLHDPSFAAKARMFRETYANRGNALSDVANQCERLLEASTDR